eukprot:396803_1
MVQSASCQGMSFFVSRVEPGVILIKVEGVVKKFACSGGWIYVSDTSKVTISSAECIPMEDIDSYKVEDALTTAKAAAGERAQMIAAVEIDFLEKVKAELVC